MLSRSPLARQVEDAFAGKDIVAPAHVDAEVMSALMRLERRGTIDSRRSGAALRRLSRLPLDRVPSTTQLLDEAWSFRHNLTAYDALYAALARRLACPLVTRDRRLAAALTEGPTIVLVG